MPAVEQCEKSKGGSAGPDGARAEPAGSARQRPPSTPTRAARTVLQQLDACPRSSVAVRGLTHSDDT